MRELDKDIPFVSISRREEIAQGLDVDKWPTEIYFLSDFFSYIERKRARLRQYIANGETVESLVFGQPRMEGRYQLENTIVCINVQGYAVFDSMLIGKKGAV